MGTKTTISFVRHGAVDNPDAIAYGRLPGFHLNDKGRKQAQAVAAALNNKPVAVVFTSPLERTRQTAEIILAHHPDAALHVSPLITEIHSPFEGRPASELQARNWDAYTGIGPEYEQPADILKRVRQFIAEVRQQYPRRHVVAVSHGDVIAFTTLWVKGLPVTPDLKQEKAHYPNYASISTLVYHTADANEMPQYTYAEPYQSSLEVL